MILVARNLASFLPYTPQAPARDNECNVARLAAEISEFDIVAVCTVATRGRLAASCPLLLLPIAHFSAQSLIYQVTLCYGFQPEGRVQLTLLYSTVTAVLRIANTSDPSSLTGQTTTFHSHTSTSYRFGTLRAPKLKLSLKISQRFTT
jgi:hypothetical protein